MSIEVKELNNLKLDNMEYNGYKIMKKFSTLTLLYNYLKKVRVENEKEINYLNKELDNFENSIKSLKELRKYFYSIYLYKGNYILVNYHFNPRFTIYKRINEILIESNKNIIKFKENDKYYIMKFTNLYKE